MSPEVAALVVAARARCARMDLADRRNGFATPADVDVPQQLAIALSALEAALQTKSWEIVADALCLVDDARKALIGAAS